MGTFSVRHSVHDSPADPHSHKTMLVFLSKVYPEIGAKRMEIKVAEINTHLK